jgi:hypothetical protein
MADPEGKSSFACDAGTAYLSHTLSVKVADREKFLDFVRASEAWEFLDVGVLKAPVKAWMEQHPTSPTNTIGLSTEPIVKCHIRKG